MKLPEPPPTTSGSLRVTVATDGAQESRATVARTSPEGEVSIESLGPDKILQSSCSVQTFRTHRIITATVWVRN